MKAKISYILYCIALILVITPIVMEQTGNPLEPMLETFVLIGGLLVLTIGKVLSALKRRRAGESSIFHDGVIIVCLIGVMVYLCYTML